MGQRTAIGSGHLPLFLASTSVAALLFGGGASPAQAACGNVVGPGAVASFTNPTGTTIPCVDFQGATVSGNVVNNGVITPGGANGISFSDAPGPIRTTIDGVVSNTGTISVGGTGNGILSTAGQTLLGGIVNRGTITAGGDGIQIQPTSTFGGGITSSGTISAHNFGILSGGVSTFTGGITNTGTITAAVFDGIQVNGGIFQPVTLSGNVSNGGKITAGGAGISVLGVTTVGLLKTISSFGGSVVNTGSITAGKTGIIINKASTVSGGVTNNGSVVASTKTGILVSVVSTFAGGIVGTGSISAGTYGINLNNVSNFSGGISSGAIAATANTGIAVTNVSTFAGGITSNGNITAGQKGIFIQANTVSVFTGNIVNNGTITPGSGSNGIAITSSGSALLTFLTFNGNITNNGTIAASGLGFAIAVVGDVNNGGIVNNGSVSSSTTADVVILINQHLFGTAAFGIVNSNTGTITGGRVAAVAIEGDTFLGGITNAGTISAPNAVGILVNFLLPTFSGGITNAGNISGAVGIDISAQTFLGALVNSGNITGTGGTALNLAPAGNAITIDQQAGTITGAIDLSTHGDTLNISGGAINGNVVGQNAGDTVNFALGAGRFTYASPFAMTGLTLVNFNSGTVFVDGSISGTNINVNNGGTVGGTGSLVGTVDVLSGGTLMPGQPLGTLNVTGSVTFNAGSFYSVHVTPATSSATNITGTTTIGGGTVDVTLQQLGSYHNTYTIVTASTGRVGTFSGLAFTNGFSGTSSLSYDATHVFLTLNGAGLLGAPPGTNLNINQQNVLNGINNAILSGQTPPAQFQNLLSLSGAALANALTLLSGEPATDAGKGANELMVEFIDVMLDQGLAGPGNGGGPSSFLPEREADLPPDIALAYAGVLAKAPPKPVTFEQRWNAWGAGFGGYNKTNGDPVVGSNDVISRTWGSAAGIDYRADPDTVFGFALAGGGTNWGLAQGLGGGRSDAFQAGLYGRKSLGPAYLAGALAFADHWFTTNRTAAFGDQLTARFNGQSLAARLEGGYRYTLPLPGSLFGVTPYAAVQPQWFHTPSFSETDLTGGGFALAFNAMNATDTRGELGARFEDLTTLNGLPLILRSRVAWAHDWASNPALSAVFQALPGSNFTVNGPKPASDSALATASSELRLSPNWSLTSKFIGEFARGAQTYAGTGTVSYQW